MINDTTTRFRLFFANRLSKIHASSSAKDWRHIDSEQNPADFCSRGTKADEDAKWEMFHFGPKFLYQPEDKWPKTNLCRQPTAYVFAAAVDPVPEISQFFQDVAAKSSSWFWKLRRIAILRQCARRWRAASKAKTRESRTNLPRVDLIERGGIEEAEKDLIKEIQRKHFGQEMDLLLRRNVSSASSRGNVQPKS